MSIDSHGLERQMTPWLPFSPIHFITFSSWNDDKGINLQMYLRAIRSFVKGSQ